SFLRILRCRLSFEEVEDLGRAGSLPVASPPGQKIAQLVAHHREAPAPKCPSLRVVFQPPSRRSHGPKHFLGKVGRIGLRQTMPSGETMNERGVQLYKLGPGFAIASISDANKKAGLGLR